MSSLPSARALALALKPQHVPLTPAQKAIAEACHPVTLLAGRLTALGLPAPVREYRFHPSRRWAFDLAWPDHLLAVEYDGDQHRTDTHQYEKDITRFDRATAATWNLVRVRSRGLLPDGRSETVERVRDAFRTSRFPQIGESRT